MKTSIKISESFGKHIVLTGTAIIFLFVLMHEVSAQEPPPRPPVITTIQNLGFGAFTHGLSGGTVTIFPNGNRSGSIGIVLLGLGITPTRAQYNIVANQGTLIALLVDPSGYPLTGSEGGTMIFHVGSSIPSSPFVISTQPPASTTLYVGGILTVSGDSGTNPPGSYSGTFDITFVVE